MASTQVEISAKPGASFRTETLLKKHGSMFMYDPEQEQRIDVYGLVGQPALIVRNCKDQSCFWLPAEEIEIEFV